MSEPTVSEEIFEKLCSSQGISFMRIAEEDEIKTADYKVYLGLDELIVEVKQLDPNIQDKELTELWGKKDSSGARAPVKRVRGLLDDGYHQIKNSAGGKQPTMMVIYNNSGEWNEIDAFTISTAMFGTLGIKRSLTRSGTLVTTRVGYMGNRKVTESTFRALSAVAVLGMESGSPFLEVYHNPFATNLIKPENLSELASSQFVHPNPHDTGFIQWEPTPIK